MKETIVFVKRNHFVSTSLPCTFVFCLTMTIILISGTEGCKCTRKVARLAFLLFLHELLKVTFHMKISQASIISLKKSNIIIFLKIQKSSKCCLFYCVIIVMQWFLNLMYALTPAHLRHYPPNKIYV